VTNDGTSAGSLPGMTDLSRARTALRDAHEALDVLEAGCCVPTRSPRMADLRETLNRAEAELEAAQHETGPAVIATLEHAGAQIGSLQVACCAPARLPLYTRILADLTTAQRTVTAGFDLDH
jgi:hypothetical protein